MKPGKPVVLGQIGAPETATGARFLGLPGNPVSSFVVFQLLATPFMRTLQGETGSDPIAYPVIAAFTKSAGSREEYIRVRIVIENSVLRAQLFDNQSSGVLFSLAWADGLVRQRIDQEINNGDTVEFLPLRQGQL
jgi:molybdopterin molybdotransferase